MLSGLNDEQREAVVADAPALRILAGAGSGKTRVLTRRIAHRASQDEIDPRRVLAVTFTRKAASELRTRVGALGMRSDINAGTFHAIALTQLRQRWEERGIRPPELLDRKVGYVARLMGRQTSKTAPLDAVSEIEWAKSRMISAAEYPAAIRSAGRRPSIDAGLVAQTYQSYEEKKLSDRMVDFDDLLRLASRDIEADEAFAAARRWRFRHIFVDEFQDVNPLQFRLLQNWVGPDHDLCVVGDPNQAIYAWNGADSRYLDKLEEWYPDVKTVELRQNYRSTPQIIGMANVVLSQTSNTPFTLTPNRGDGPIPSIHVASNETEEARMIARRARDLHSPGSRWKDQAVLVRTNAQLALIEEVFTDAKIPFRSRSGKNLLQTQEVKSALATLRSTAGGMEPFLADLETTVDQIDPSNEQDDERRSNLAELVRLGREYLALDPSGAIPGFYVWIRSVLAGEATANKDGIELATFHVAKGLEWPIVHIAGLEEGFVPIHYAETEEAIAEEHRLLYVALTRAERVLYMSYANSRAFGSRSLKRKPSPHIETLTMAADMLSRDTSIVDLSDRIDLARAEMAERNKASEINRRSSNKRRKPSRSSDPIKLEPEQKVLFESLRAWRKTRARAANVSAFVILNDATLTQLCVRAPSTESELLDIAGIGTIKAQEFGAEILSIVADHDAGSVATGSG